ncbi:MAG: M1 family metallopeptidase [Bacteroidetes bacterium]|nr:M1 family metallopeptidase [Bacteroidota bacterium]
MKKSFPILLAFSFISAIAQDSKIYFQQESNYTIHVKLDDTKNEFTADETIEYTNNSSDELTFIWFHIWPNAYKNNSTPLAKQLIADGNRKFYFASQDERGWIDGLDFKVNGQNVKIEPGESIDIVKLMLNEPLKPGGKITITTPFHVHIPIGVFSRLGHIGQQYQITQWYPKPAVYDKYGWHPIPFLNQGEFYSEWGKFDVFITVPKNYVVGATGDYVDGDEEIAWLNKKAEQAKEMEVFPRDTTFPPSSSEWKTLHLHQEKIHDFAWFADKRYYVMKDEVELPYSKRKVTTWGLFTGAEGKLWKQSAKYVADAVYNYSLWNGEYPYNHATAVDGALSAGGGMEYPNITVIGKMNSAMTLDQVIAHEVGHNWFYGILGSNERDHAWMDEGINSFNEGRYMEKKYPADSVRTFASTKIAGVNVDIGKILGIPNFDERTLFDLGYRFNAVKKMDQPNDLTSAEYTTVNYGTIVYGKTAVLFEYLRSYLGTELYDKCAQKYFEDWKFKHPYPADIKKVYEEVSGKNLSWFFDDILKTTKQIDYKILSCKKSQCANSFTGDCWEVKVKNNGKINSPFPVSAMKDGKIVNTTWFVGFSGTKSVNVYTIDFDKVKIDAENKMPDINRQNNNYKMRGLCKKTEPFNLKMMGLIHNTDKTQLFWMPVMGWNNYNKFMLGAAVYNNFLPEKKLEWVFMPMYSFTNKDLAGGASVYYNIHPNKIFQTICFGVNAERYCYSNYDLPNLNFNKITPDFTFEIKKKHLNSSVKQMINIRQVNVTKEIAVGDYSFKPPVYRYDSVSAAINDFTYTIDNSRKINPYSVALDVQQGEGFVKNSVTANYKVTFKKKKKGLDIRFFGGEFIDKSINGNGDYRFRMSGFSPKGIEEHDYMYDNVFLGRRENTGFLSQQFSESDGAIKTYTAYGQTYDWIAALNLKCSLPGKIPFKLFADFASVANQPQIFYDAGIYISLVPNIIDVYIPLLMSKDIKSEFYTNPDNSDLKNPTPDNLDPDAFKRTMRMIRFTFNIHKLNPFEMVRNLSL